MLKKSFVFFMVFGLCLNEAECGFLKPSDSLTSNEKKRIDILIESTEKSLQTQIQLREKIIDYQTVQDLHLKNPNDNDILFRLVMSAYRVLELIKDHDLLEVFDPEFIDELKILSKAVSKRGIPKP